MKTTKGQKLFNKFVLTHCRDIEQMSREELINTLLEVSSTLEAELTNSISTVDSISNSIELIKENCEIESSSEIKVYIDSIIHALEIQELCLS